MEQALWGVGQQGLVGGLLGLVAHVLCRPLIRKLQPWAELWGILSMPEVGVDYSLPLHKQRQASQIIPLERAP